MADVDKVYAENTVHWALRKMEADLVIAFFAGSFHAWAVRDAADSRELAMRLREFADKLEGR